MKPGKLVLVIGIVFNTLTAHADKLRVCVEDKLYIPYLDRNTDKNTDGLLIQLVQQSARAQQFETVVIRQSWPRCLAQVVSGEVDALLPIIYTNERAKQMVFPLGAELNNSDIYLYQVRYPFFIKKGRNFSFANQPHTFRHGIGTPYQYVSYQILADYQLLPVYDYDVEAGLAMVAAERLDAYVVETLIGLNSVANLGLQDVVVPASEHLLESVWHIAFNSAFFARHSQRLEAFWTELALLRATMPSLAEE